MCFISKQKYFDSIINNWPLTFFKCHNKNIGQRERRAIPTQNFTGLFYAVYNNRIEFVKYLLPELEHKLVSPFDLSVNNSIMKLAPNTTALHLAIILNRLEIVKIIIQYLESQATKRLESILAEPNDDLHSNIHYFVLSNSPEMQLLLFRLKFYPHKKEFENMKQNPILFAIKHQCPVVLEYILTLAKACPYKELMKETLTQRIQTVYQMLNEMLTDQQTNQEQLTLIRNLVVNFFYNKFPDIAQCCHKYLDEPIVREPSNDLPEIQYDVMKSFGFRASFAKCPLKDENSVKVVSKSCTSQICSNIKYCQNEQHSSENIIEEPMQDVTVQESNIETQNNQRLDTIESQSESLSIQKRTIHLSNSAVNAIEQCLDVKGLVK
ncbi:Conserved_hypothetical protein [Hexamita inflata]|uniref:Uncharacterized protein n=1 Tax=Hexamita inflata TaxID=28002 RepID=A0AA86TDC9_9EUKA|nr:Conserved hypothetical protein [Hexamita inflata]